MKVVFVEPNDQKVIVCITNDLQIVDNLCFSYLLDDIILSRHDLDDHPMWHVRSHIDIFG